MFDWNDEELKNIIWGEAGESGDHIVPYLEASEESSKRREWSEENGGNKLAEQKTPGTKIDIHENKLETKPNFKAVEVSSASGFCMDSWPDLPLSNSIEAAQLQAEADIFQNPDEGQEQSVFIDYGWVGSFDDLDQIFSNDESIFGNVSLNNTDELWSSCKDTTNRPGKSFPLPVESPSLGLGDLSYTPEHFRSKPECAQDDDCSFTLGNGKAKDHSPHHLQSTESILNQLEYGGNEIKPKLKGQTEQTVIGNSTAANSHITAENSFTPNQLPNKGYKQTKTKRRKKSEEKNQVKLYQDQYGNWSSSGNLPNQFKGEFIQSTVQSPNSALSQPGQVHGPASLHYHQMPNSFVVPSAYGNIPSTYGALSIMPHLNPGEIKHQAHLSNYKVPSGNANSVNKLADSPRKSQTMTPQERIEKLRRRQQMQAMLAIQKQQQQLDQVSCTEQAEKFSQENHVQHGESCGMEVGDPSTLPSFEPTSPVEQDDSNAISLAVNDYSVEDKILYRLQEIVAKLDVRIRICIQDSLFRLAKSAMQRHYASDTSSANSCSKDEKAAKDETSNYSRNLKIPDVETETNPIDRTVAHLLFHRPMDLSGNHSDVPESPISTKHQGEQKSLGISKSSMANLPETVKDEPNCSHEGGCQDNCSNVDPTKTLDSSEFNMSSNDLANDGAVGEIGTS